MEGKKVVYNPPRPTMGKLGHLFGEPPWALEIDDYEGIPQEATDFVGAIVWRNRVYAATGMLFKKGERC